MTGTPDLTDQYTVHVLQNASGARLDKWLADALPQTSRTRLRILIEQGAVIIADVPQRDPAYRIKPGQMITVYFPKPEAARPMAQQMDLDIIFEDNSLIVINKPPGLVVHPAPGNPDKTLVNALLAHCGDNLQGIGGVRRPGIVHRIDKDTSGLLVAAKTQSAHTGLAAQFAEHSVDRTYNAFVWELPRPPKGRIIGAIGRSPRNRKKMAIVIRGGKAAETLYTTAATFGAVAAHVRCTLTTGRTHQIRVHMASRGHPLIGDSLYGGGRAKLLRKFTPAGSAAIKALPRQALHAATIGFLHPANGKRLKFKCPLPADMELLKDVLANETKKQQS